MRTIWKFLVPIEPVRPVKLCPMPHGAEILHVGRDPETGWPAIWAKVAQSAPAVDRKFIAYGTGALIPEEATYLGTAVNDPYVWHVHELPHGG